MSRASVQLSEGFSTDKLDIFVVSGDKFVYTAAWEPSASNEWHGWWNINGTSPGSRVTAVSRGKDKLDVFVVRTDDRVWTAAWDPAVGSDWRGWNRIGDVRVPFGGYITAVSRSKDKLDIFVTDVDGKVRSAAWEPGNTDGWHGWWHIQGGIASPGSPVAAVSRSKDKLDLFVVGTDGHVATASWEPSATNEWRGWWSIGNIKVPAKSKIHAVSRNTNKLDIFATDVKGRVMTAAWEPANTDGWHGWWYINQGMAMPGAPVYCRVTQQRQAGRLRRGDGRPRIHSFLGTRLQRMAGMASDRSLR